MITCSVEIAHTIRNLGLPDWYTAEYGALLVDIGDGEYTAVYGFSGCVVYAGETPDDLYAESAEKLAHILACDAPNCNTCADFNYDPYSETDETEKWWVGLADD
jgi:hypothetical protein